MLLEVAESLQLGRNIFVALLAFQSWKSFINCWVSAVTDTGASPNASDGSSKSASMVLKVIFLMYFSIVHNWLFFYSFLLVFFAG